MSGDESSCDSCNERPYPRRDGCDERDGGAGGDGGGSGGSGGGGGDCEPKVCFDVETEQDISFLGFIVDACLGGDIEITVFDDEGDPVIEEQQTVGQGQNCDGALSPNDVKIEGIDTKSVEVCVTFTNTSTAGDVQIYAKTGTDCELVASHDGECTPCESRREPCDSCD